MEKLFITRFSIFLICCILEFCPMRLTINTFSAAYNALSSTPTQQELVNMGAQQGLPEWYMIACIGTTEGEGYVNELYLNYEWSCTFLNYWLENYYPQFCSSKDAMYAIMSGWSDVGYYSEAAVTARFNNASDSTLKCVYLSIVDRDRNTRAVSGDYYDEGYYAYYDSVVYTNPLISVWYTTGQPVIDDSGYATYSMRTVSPVGEYNPCYMSNLYGASWANAWNTCIYGNPTETGADVLRNCTGYAQGRALEIYNELKNNVPTSTANQPFHMLNANAGEWYGIAQNNGFTCDYYYPSDGAIMVWGQYGQAGHVAVVEKVVDTNTVISTESGWGGIAGQAWITHNRYRGSDGLWSGDLFTMGGYNFLGFIYNPAVGSPGGEVPPPPTPPAWGTKKSNLWLYLRKRGYII